MKKRIMRLGNWLYAWLPHCTQHLMLHRVHQKQDTAIFLMCACSFEEQSFHTWSLQCYLVPYIISAESGSGGAEWIKRSGVNLTMYDHKPSTEPKFNGRSR